MSYRQKLAYARHWRAHSPQPRTGGPATMHLAAQMPPAKIGSRGLMELRIARKIAALSGIPGDPHSSDDAGRGRSWLVDYRELTTTEITLGGPVIPHGDTPDGGLFHRPERGGRRFRHVDGDAVDYAPIPNVA